MDYTVHGILQARILEWAAVPFSRGYSQPRDRTQVSLIAGRFFTSWATREALNQLHSNNKKKKKIEKKVLFMLTQKSQLLLFLNALITIMRFSPPYFLR